VQQVKKFLEEVTEGIRPLEVAYNRAYWDAAVTGKEEDNQRQAETHRAFMRFWGDPSLAEGASAFTQANGLDPITARQLRLVFLSSSRYQQDEATLGEIIRLEAEVRQEFYQHRARMDGRTLSDNEVDDLLKNTRDSDEARAVWESSKEIGRLVSDRIRQLARLRNAAARANGFRDHFQRWLELNEIPEATLLDLFGRLDQASQAPYRGLKAQIDRVRAERFGVAGEALRPWHYGDRFFQDPPSDLDDVDRDAPFAEKDPRDLTRRTYEGLGMDVQPILDRSDLYERPGKNQHAFCMDIDRAGDIRTLDNLRPDYNWNETLLHELGHGVYWQYIDPSLPWLVRDVSHILTTEAIALLMGSQVNDPRWLTEIAGVDPADPARLTESARQRTRATRLIFTRWCLVVTNFERALYADPEGDLDTVFWDLVERYQEIHRPDARVAPDWAAKIHIATDPVYYQNYELGYLITAQIEDRIRREYGGLVGRPEAGRWLIDHVFRPGATQEWTAHVQTATGEALNPDYFVRGLA
jgi:peptidyl-dipeptidase A